VRFVAYVALLVSPEYCSLISSLEFALRARVLLSFVIKVHTVYTSIRPPLPLTIFAHPQQSLEDRAAAIPPAIHLRAAMIASVNSAERGSMRGDPNDTCSD
jgi:hypothetical protein